MPSARLNSRVTWAKFRVTVVATVATLILITLLYLLSGATLLREQAKLYIYIPDATGLAIGSPVEVNGIEVGTVTAVQLTNSNQPDRTVKVTLEVIKERLNTISEDAYAEIASESLIGDKLISISSGTHLAPVRPGSELHFKPQEDLMHSLDLTQFETQLRAVDVMITDIEQGKSPIGQFVLGDQMYVDLNRRVQDIENAVQAAANTASSLGEALYTDRLYRKISEPVVLVDQTLSRLESGQGAAGEFLHDPAQFESLRKELSDLRKSIADLRGSSFVTSDAAYVGWNRTATSLTKNVEEMNANPLFNTSDMYESLAGAAKEMRDTVKDFRQNPQKYLRVKMF
jgi:phospholipid/cholesterol/gamma-HCH transport system substrate-binding protein